MNVQALAAKLKKAGLAVQSITEGDDMVDGSINITEAVHIQVPNEFGYGFPSVGREKINDDGDLVFIFYPERKTVSALVADVREALGMVAAVSK